MEEGDFVDGGGDDGVETAAYFVWLLFYWLCAHARKMKERLKQKIALLGKRD